MEARSFRSGPAEPLASSDPTNRPRPKSVPATIFRTAVWVLILISVLLGSLSAVQAEETRYVLGEIVVKFRAGTSLRAQERLAARMRTSVRRKSDFSGAQMLSLPAGLGVEEAVRAYQSDPDVLYAEPNYIRRSLTPPPNDPFFNRQWGLLNTGQSIPSTPPFSGKPGADINATAAWDLTTGSSNIVIAEIDSGVDYTHPDLAASLLGGINYSVEFSCDSSCNCSTINPPVPPTTNPMDDAGHGTHVAGIMAAQSNNGIGVAGLLWNAKIIPLKILDQYGCGTVETEVQAINYAISNGAQIINASFGSPGYSSMEQDAIQAAKNAGVLFVAAAGNDSSNNDDFPIYPASSGLSNVISVAASDAGDGLAGASNYGKNRVDLAAPGDCIYSTTPLGVFQMRGMVSCGSTIITASYAFLSGTSMATPFVSGAAGLLLSQEPSLTPEEIHSILVSTADPVDGLKGRVASSGRLNAFAALQRTKGTGMIGGGGGCGSPIGMIRSFEDSPVPPAQAAVYLAVLFLPVLFPIVRKRLALLSRRNRSSRSRRVRGASVATLICLIALKASTAAAQDDVPPYQAVQSVAVKLGYHRYNESDYLDTNSGLVSRSDLAGPAYELEYDWRWREDLSLSVSAGGYTSKADFKGTCCNSVRMTTNYLLFTPKHYGRVWVLEWYLGGGLGLYHLNRDIQGIIDDHFSSNTLGIHGVAGLGWPVHSRFSAFTEFRYALAKVKDADSFGDSLDIGGLFYFLGARWQFSRGGGPNAAAD